MTLLYYLLLLIIPFVHCGTNVNNLQSLSIYPCFVQHVVLHKIGLALYAQWT